MGLARNSPQNPDIKELRGQNLENNGVSAHLESISPNRRRYAALCRRVLAQLQSALFVFSVKVVRHKKQEVFCGRLWKKAGAIFGKARKYGTIGPSANSVAWKLGQSRPPDFPQTAPAYMSVH